MLTVVSQLSACQSPSRPLRGRQLRHSRQAEHSRDQTLELVLLQRHVNNNVAQVRFTHEIGSAAAGM